MDVQRLGRRLSRVIWDELPLERIPARGRTERQRIREALLESVEVVLGEEARRYGRALQSRRDLDA
jgi:hypothetical protein